MAAALALLFLIAALLAGTLPSVFGYEAYVVYSGSMEPSIGVGDLAVVAPARTDQLMVGDIITYRTAQRPDIVVTHRLVGIALDEQGRTSFQTKGDANTTADQVTVDQGAVLGRVAYNIPRLGYLVEFSKRAEGKVLLIGIPGLLLALDYLLGARTRRKVEVRTPRGEVGELLARGRVALQNGGTGAALGLFDRAIAADPHLDEAWLLKAECLADAQERLACLRAGLTVNPSSTRLREAVERATASEAAAS
ncbi:MAG: signal peptidase I [Chloroflexi bacterium]|nr:signal peptidase I [Chloroflexota bacterium]